MTDNGGDLYSPLNGLLHNYEIHNITLNKIIRLRHELSHVITEDIESYEYYRDLLNKCSKISKYWNYKPGLIGEDVSHKGVLDFSTNLSLLMQLKVILAINMIYFIMLIHKSEFRDKLYNTRLDSELRVSLINLYYFNDSNITIKDINHGNNECIKKIFVFIDSMKSTFLTEINKNNITDLMNELSNILIPHKDEIDLNKYQQNINSQLYYTIRILTGIMNELESKHLTSDTYSKIIELINLVKETYDVFDKSQNPGIPPIPDNWAIIKGSLSKYILAHKETKSVTRVDTGSRDATDVGDDTASQIIEFLKYDMEKNKNYYKFIDHFLKKLCIPYDKLMDQIGKLISIYTPFSFSISNFTKQSTADIYKNENGDEIVTRKNDKISLNIAKKNHNSDYLNFINMAVDCSFYLHEISLISENHGIKTPIMYNTSFTVRAIKATVYALAFIGAASLVIFSGPVGAGALQILSGALKVLGVLMDQIGGVGLSDTTQEREAWVGQGSHLGHSVSDMLASVAIFTAAVRDGVNPSPGGGGLKIHVNKKEKVKSSRKFNKSSKKFNKSSRKFNKSSKKFNKSSKKFNKSSKKFNKSSKKFNKSYRKFNKSSNKVNKRCIKKKRTKQKNHKNIK